MENANKRFREGKLKRWYELLFDIYKITYFKNLTGVCGKKKTQNKEDSYDHQTSTNPLTRISLHTTLTAVPLFKLRLAW